MFKQSVNSLFRKYAFYINSKFPSIDSLKTVQRRLLYVLKDYKNYTKSATIVGETIGKYHPHGDSSTYAALVNLVHRNLAIGKGNWGSSTITLENIPPAAYRYTEVKANYDNPLIKDMYELLPYTIYVTNEMGYKEPLLMPCKYPLTLVYFVQNKGDNTIGVTIVNNSVTFTIESLSDHVKHLIDKLGSKIEYISTYNDVLNVIDTYNNVIKNNYNMLILPRLDIQLSDFTEKVSVNPLDSKIQYKFVVHPKVNIDPKTNVAEIEILYPVTKIKKLLEKYKNEVKFIDHSKEHTRFCLYCKKSLLDDKNFRDDLNRACEISDTIINTISLPTDRVLVDNVPLNYEFVDMPLTTMLLSNLCYYYITRKNKIISYIEAKKKSIREKEVIKVIREELKKKQVWDIDPKKFSVELAAVNSQYSQEEYLNIMTTHNIKSILTVNLDIQKDASELKNLEKSLSSLMNNLYKEYEETKKLSA
jgi:hypothetical protein